MTIILSIGRWGGVYVAWGWSKRFCLGWVALTFLPCDIDDLFSQRLYEDWL